MVAKLVVSLVAHYSSPIPLTGFPTARIACDVIALATFPPCRTSPPRDVGWTAQAR